MTGRALPVDVAFIDERPFINMATAGFATDLTHETPEELKSALGRAAYLVTGLGKFHSIEPTRARLVAEGLEQTHEFLVLAVGNARCAGGGRMLCPDASIDDGLLDVAIISEAGDRGPVATAADLATRGIDDSGAQVTRHRVRALEVHGDAPLHVSVDGEPYGGRSVRFSVRQGALRAVLPTGSPLLSSG